MKNFLLVLILFPLLSNAKFYKAVVTLNDGNLKNGFVELPDYPDDKNLKFRSEEKGKTEKLSVDLVKGFEFTNDKNEIVKYVTLYLADPKPFTNDKFKFDDKKSWLKVVKEGKINIYVATSVYSPGSGTGGFSTLHVQKENDKYAYFFADGGSGGFNFNMNGFQTTKKYLNTIFGTDCPKLVELLNKDEFNKKGASYLIDLYEKNCGKN